MRGAMAVALALVGCVARTGPLEVMIDSDTSFEARGEAHHQLVTTDFATLAPKLARWKQSFFCLCGRIGTDEPWADLRLAERCRITHTLYQFWSREYKLRCTLLTGDALMKLPPPLLRPELRESYNFSVDEDGCYLVDHLVDRATAAKALLVFIDAALLNNDTVTLVEP